MSEERNNVSPEKTEQELNEQRKIRRDKLEQLRYFKVWLRDIYLFKKL